MKEIQNGIWFCESEKVEPLMALVDKNQNGSLSINFLGYLIFVRKAATSTSLRTEKSFLLFQPSFNGIPLTLNN